MNVTLVSLRQSEAAGQAGAPALTPELLAACGARYSRNNEGLEAILSKINPSNLDKSVDSIFRMIDYGHQSIADMVPVAMFLDNISIWLAYLVWTQCPMAGGQESSTRYIKLSKEGVVDPNLLGISQDRQGKWFEFIETAFESYNDAVSFWEDAATVNPSLIRIPNDLLNDPSDKAQKQVARMKRNFAFDRSRYFLPVAALTNMMLIMSARAWTQLSQYLLSHFLPEAVQLGERIVEQLRLEAPRLCKHATFRLTTSQGLSSEFETYKALLESLPKNEESRAKVTLFPEAGVTDELLSKSLAFHENRYAWIAEPARSTSIRFGWNRVALAEIRDLNRHRTGTKNCPPVPLGFYCAEDEAHKYGIVLNSGLTDYGHSALESAQSLLAVNDPSYVSMLLLGHEFPFTHTTTLDKYIYEVELRTGTGAHYRYAKHFKDSVQTFSEKYPLTAGQIEIGTAEPE